MQHGISPLDNSYFTAGGYDFIFMNFRIANRSVRNPTDDILNAFPILLRHKMIDPGLPDNLVLTQPQRFASRLIDHGHNAFTGKHNE
ncbi:hypothetical protein SDC9_147822 [bioreactor metagenome]|uniref:Uncharacterized protein n=1 Tax=bioreactor metagenome TaxID=1076179 RepID=A0A645EGQ5_9ZZZZ